MKLIVAIIRETQLNSVREALIDAGITRISVSYISGHGQQKKEELYRGTVLVPSLIPKYRIEIAVNDEYIDLTCDTIIQAARSGVKDEGEIGDGKIFILPLEQCIRIRTNERGESAI
jgi:nitrogen regulatory protein P-II 1